MIRCSKILLYFTIAVLILWLVPWSYYFFFAKGEKSPFTLYSTVIGDFAMVEHENGKPLRVDRDGNVYTENQFDSILPMFYYRQLVADEKFPAEINGVEISPRIVQTENFMFRSTPSAANTPMVPLYPLLESMSGRVDLKMPGDVFRITSKGIEFVDIETNSVNREKSSRYTDALTNKGFVFPSTIISGNPTTRKEYDEGYLVCDKEGKLFHLKQTAGRPFVRKVDLPDGLKIEHIFLTEFKSRRTHAFVVDDKNRLYTLQTKSYDLKQLPVPSFNPEKEVISIIGNFFDWTIQISGETDTYYAVDAQSYSLIDKMERPAEEKSLAMKIGDVIFPLYLSFTSSFDKEVKPRLNF